MHKYICFLFLLFSHFGFSQIEKLLHGKVAFQDRALKNIDIINSRSKKSTSSNELGEFSIMAKVADTLIFISDHYADQKYVVTSENLITKKLTITLKEKPIDLDEVIITSGPAFTMPPLTYEDIKMAKLSNEQARPKNKDVYSGEMPYATDFVAIGKKLVKLFKRKDLKKNTFTDYVIKHFTETFFSQTLDLKPEEINLFLSYCEIDPKSKTILDQHDELALLEFLLTKKAEFKKR